MSEKDGFLATCSESVKKGIESLELQIQEKNIDFHSFNVIMR
jgi:hypothetical protein